MRIAAAALCGLALTATFPQPAFYPLCFVALVPLIAATRATSRKHAFVLGWVAGLTYYLTTWRWMLSTIANLQSISAFAALPFYAVFASYHAIQLGLFAVVVPSSGAADGARVASHPRASELAGPAILAAWWVLLEWAFPRVIPWYIADPLAASPSLRQAADLGGVYALSFILVAVNVLLANAAMSTTSRGRVQAAVAASTLVAMTGVYGQLRTSPQSPLSISSRDLPGESALQISGVQGNLPTEPSIDEAAKLRAWRVYDTLTRAAFLPEGPKAIRAVGPIRTPRTELFAGPTSHSATRELVDLMVWPETTLRSYLRRDGAFLRRIDELLRDIRTPLLTGGLDSHPDGIHEFNSAYLFIPGETYPPRMRDRIYRKRRLVWFGERVPSSIDWRTTGRFLPASGSDRITLELPRPGQPAGGSIFSPSICFEAVFPGAFNNAVRQGAGFLVNITDDSWFGDTDEPYQHLNATIFRAVETRRWLVRVSNSGISAFVDPTGQIVASLPFRTQGILAHSIQPSQGISPYVRLGDWPVGLSVLLVAGHIWGRWRRNGFRWSRR